MKVGSFEKNFARSNTSTNNKATTTREKDDKQNIQNAVGNPNDVLFLCEILDYNNIPWTQMF